MISKPVYNLMPYLYLLAGGVIIITLPGAAIAAGLLLYAYGAWLWLVRSDRRRVNSRQPASVGSRFYWGETLYELQPFFYILLGVFLIALIEHDLRLLMGPLMMLTGVAVLAIRASARKKIAQLPASLRASASPKPCRNADMKRALGLEPRAGDRSGDVDTIPLFDSTHGSTAENDGQSLEPQAHAASCDICQIEDICQTVNLDIRSVQEIMRLSQTVVPNEAFELYRQTVERIEGRPVSDDELQAVLNLLYSYSDHCATWRKTGRLGTH